MEDEEEEEDDEEEEGGEEEDSKEGGFYLEKVDLSKRVHKIEPNVISYTKY